MLEPQATIGILGGGQLGRMFAIEAKLRGYRTLVRTDEFPSGPAAQVADGEIVGPYDDETLNARFVSDVDVVTAEFENLPQSLLDELAYSVPVHPSGFSIGTCQNREKEKTFLAVHAIPHAPFSVVLSASQAHVAFATFNTKCVLKTAAFGYDGRGQVVLNPGDDAGVAFDSLKVDRAVLEQWVPFDTEISVVGARTVQGEWVAFTPGENVHKDGILDYTVAPARVKGSVLAAAVSLAGRVAEALDHVGTLGVEMFVMADGSLVVNEMAPRPHNSGHHTIDACVTNQFAQQLLAVVGAPLGDPTQHTPAVMVNLLGDLWANGEPNWDLTLHPRAHLHLYGKEVARPGRKMGHLTMLGDTVEQALTEALALRNRLDTRL
jgi:5-(carboxyamino)imidazole ribonucleotide synthase